MSEAIEKFILWRSFKRKPLTLAGDLLHLKYFCMHVRNLDVENITLDPILDWLDMMRQLGFDQNTIGKKATALRKFFEYLNHSGYTVIDPWIIPVPVKTRKLPRVANEKDYRTLLGIIPQDRKIYYHVRNLAIIKMLWYSGARNGEILSLDVGDLDLERKHAVIPTEKSRGTRPFREIFWNEETNEDLGRWLASREELKMKVEFEEPDALFVGVKGGTPTNLAKGKRLQVNAFSEVLRKYSNKAGLKVPMNPHSFRHHMGHHIVRQGGTNADVMNILGHASIQSTTTYTMMVDKELEERYEKLSPKSYPQN